MGEPEARDAPDTGGPPVPPITDAALPPWLWLTLCTLILGATLFVSFRRRKSAELYFRARDAVHHRLAALPWPLGRRGRLHLSDPEAELGYRASRHRPRSASQASDQSSLSSTSGRSPLSTPTPGDDDDDDEDDDSSPFPRTPSSSSSTTTFRTRRDYTLDTAPLRPVVSSVLSALGWTATRATSALTGHGEKSDAVARMFWGLRDSERTGAIRLTTAATASPQARATEAAATTEAARREEASPTGKAARVLGHTRSDRPAPAIPPQPFRLEEADADDDDDEREQDAVELPTHFSLGSGSGLPPPPRS
ncbi:hypothetical protein JCM3774_005059 [Rhodotorula dairenensis]